MVAFFMAAICTHLIDKPITRLYKKKVVQRKYLRYIYCTTFNNCTTLECDLEAAWEFQLVLVLVF